MKKILHNESGSILTMMIGITLVMAYLLLMLANQLEIKAASYERTRIYLTMNIIEESQTTRFEDILTTNQNGESFLENQILNDDAIMSINEINREIFFDFSSHIMYNNNIYSRRISRFFDEESGIRE